MRFLANRRRRPPSVIIVALIDVLIVVLIFMMVATTFKQDQPALRLALPESNQTNQISADLRQLVIEIQRDPPYLHLSGRPVTLERLREELQQAITRQPDLTVSLAADQAAPFGQIVRVMEVAKESGIRGINAFTRKPGSP
jgi:biopolymer transport protein ExbD